MRPTFISALAIGFCVASALAAAPEAAAATPEALTQGMAALARQPADRAVARAAFELAITTGGEPAALAQAHFRLGVLDEEDVELRSALAHYHACVEAAPSSRWARTARSRITWIDQRSEGDLAPLIALQRVRNNPAKSHDPEALEQLALEAESFPAGPVRAEARVLVAEAWLGQTMRRERALGELRKVTADPSSPPAAAVFAQRDLVLALLADGRLDDAATEIHARHLDSLVQAKVERLLRRRTIGRAARVELLLAFGLTLAWGVRALLLRRRSTRAKSVAMPAHNMRGLLLASVLALALVSTLALAFVVADITDSRHLHQIGL
jgi:hypothetical protein